MKIAQVCPRYPPYIGGVETHVNEISKRLASRGFEVDVLTTDPLGNLPKEENLGGVTVKRFKSWAPSESYYVSWQLKKYLSRNSVKYDVVHAHSYHALPALYAAQAKSRNRLVFTSHYHGKGHTFFRNLLHVPWMFVARKAFKRADKVICVSNYERNLVISKFRINGEKIALIPNGLNLKEFNSLKRQKKNCKVILYVGRLEKYKGVDNIIRCLPKLDNNFLLEIVGKGPHKEGLIRLVNSLKVQDRVRFYQNLPRSELLQKYANADLFILLSAYEAFGISIAEALAAGTPCIVANTSALSEWIDGENCFGIDYPIIVENLVKVIHQVMGKTAISMRFSDWEDVVNKLERIYNETMEEQTINDVQP